MVETFWRAGLQGMWDLSSPNRDWTLAPALDVWSLNHWLAWEVPKINFKLITFLNGATQKSKITYMALGVFL